MSTNFCIVMKNEEKSWKISSYVSCWFLPIGAKRWIVILNKYRLFLMCLLIGS
jgi:hypothetical protein